LWGNSARRGLWGGSRVTGCSTPTAFKFNFNKQKGESKIMKNILTSMVIIIFVAITFKTANADNTILQVTDCNGNIIDINTDINEIWLHSVKNIDKFFWSDIKKIELTCNEKLDKWGVNFPAKITFASGKTEERDIKYLFKTGDGFYRVITGNTLVGKWRVYLVDIKEIIVKGKI
jgi:hypothetical protein